MLKDINDYKDFEDRLKKLKIDEAHFAQLLGYSSDAIRKWKDKGKVPRWVKYPLAYFGMIRDSENAARSLGITQETCKK